MSLPIDDFDFRYLDVMLNLNHLVKVSSSGMICEFKFIIWQPKKKVKVEKGKKI